MDHTKIAKALWQIAPRNTGAIAVKHGFDETPIVLCRHANRAFTARQQIFDAFSLIVA